MKKIYAIALLGGTPTKAAKVLGQTRQSVGGWPETLSETQEAFVLFKYAHLPIRQRKIYYANAKATEL